MKKVIPFILVFLLSLSLVSAFPLIGSHDGLTFGADFGGWWIPDGNSMNLLMNDYNDWYTFYVDSVDANGCMVGIAPGQGETAAAMANIDYVNLNDIVEDSGTQFGVYQLDLVGTIRCRVSYSFDFLGPISTTGPAVTTCAEIDGGFAPYTYGSLTHNIATVPQPADDYCVDVDTLYEYYCASTDLFWVSDSSGMPNGDSCTLLGDTLSESWDTYTCEQIGTLNHGAEFECPYGCNVAEGRCNLMSEAPVEEGDEVVEEPTDTYTFCIGKVEGTHCATDSSSEAVVPCDGNGNLGGATEICQYPEVCVEDVGQGNAECAEEVEDEGDTVVDLGESSCTETDFGNDPHQYGVTTHILGNTGSELHPDYCFDATTLREYYCEAERTLEETTFTYYTYEDYECPGGCVDGECIATCSETDGGFATHAGGTMTHEFVQFASPITDYCYSGGDKLMEYYCSDALYSDENPNNDHQRSVLCDHGCIEDANGGRCRYASELFNPGNIIVEIADWFGGFFNQDEPEMTIQVNNQPIASGYEWIVDASTEGALAWPVIRGWDQGSFETNLECPAGYVVYSMEVEAERWAGKPHVLGVLLHCAHAGGDDLLDLTDVTTVGWQNTPTGSTPFGAYNDDVITGMRGYYTTSGIEHMKVFDARQTQYIYNDNVPYTVGGMQSWLNVEDSLSITTSANSVAYCGGSDSMSQRDSVSALSGLRIYTTTRNSMDVVSGLQLRCTTIDRIPNFGFN